VVFAWGDVSNVSPDGRVRACLARPSRFRGSLDVVGIAAGGERRHGSNVDVSMALTWDGKLYTWGYKPGSQLGTGNFTDSFVPQACIRAHRAVVSLPLAASTHLALLDNGTLWGWGDNSKAAELGDGTATSHSSPAAVGSGLSKDDRVDCRARLIRCPSSGDFSLLAGAVMEADNFGDGHANHEGVSGAVRGV